MSGASYLISPTEVQIGRVTLEHLHMLDYDGEACNGDEGYDYFRCKHDHLFEVSSLYGSFNNYVDQILPNFDPLEWTIVDILNDTMTLTLFHVTFY